MKNKTSGNGFVGLLTVAFIVLKLCHVIEWKWVWVLSPLWIDLILVIAIAIVFSIIKDFDHKGW